VIRVLTLPTRGLLPTAAAVSLLTFALPASSAAQPTWSSRIDEVRKEVRLRAGPFYLKPNLLLKDLGTDDNVFNSAGDQRSDFTFTVSPNAEVYLPMARRALFKTTAATDLVWFAEYEAERSIDPQVAVRGEVYLARLMLFGETAYLNTRQRPNYDVDVRSRHVENNLSAGTEIALSPRFSIEVMGRRSDMRYDADAQFAGTALQRTLNGERHGIQLTARHRLTPLTTIAARYETLRDRFEFSPSRDSQSYRIMPGVEFKPQALLKGTAYVGYRQFTPSDVRALPAFSGLVAQLGLSYTLLGATSFGVSYRRDLTYSYEELQPFFVDASVGASIRQALGRRFDVIVSADRHRYEYQDLLTAPPSPNGLPRIDTTWNYAASFGYRLGREGRIGFGVSYWQRESTTRRFRDFDNLRIGTSISHGF
jgi:hypothetical protein